MMPADGLQGLDELAAEIALDAGERQLISRALRMLAYAAPESAPPPQLRDRVLARLAEGEAADGRGATFVEDHSYFARAAMLDWTHFVPGIEMKFLYRDPATGAQAFLVRMEPNIPFPPHSHHAIEDLYLIEGDAHVGDIRMVAGDYCRAPIASDHNHIRSGNLGVTAFVVSR